MAEKPIDAIEEILAGYPALLWHRCPDSRGCCGIPGLPDFLIIGPGGILWREAKPHAGEHPRGGQVAWKYGIMAHVMNWAVWTPADVASGLVQRELDQLTQPSPAPSTGPTQ